MVNRLTLPLADWVAAASLAQAGDAQLLHRFAKAGEQQSFATLVKRHGPMVWGVVRRLLRNHQDAEDAFQATFLILARKADTLRQPHLLPNWLHGVAHRTALQLRTRRRYHTTLSSDIDIAEAPTDQLAWRECGLLIDRAIEQLPGRLRIVFLLCQAEGLTTLAAARRINVPEGTVVSRLHRARKQLQRLLSRHGITSAAGAVVAAWSLALPETLSALTTRSLLVSAPSALVAGLAQGVLTTMMWIKLTTAAVVVSTLGIVGAGAATVIVPGTGDKAGQQVSALPVQQKGDNKDDRIKLLMRELEAARADAAKALAVERQLRDQLEAEKQRSEAVKNFLQNNLLAEKAQSEQRDVTARTLAKEKEMQARQAEQEALVRQQEMQARKQVERMQQERQVQQNKKTEQLQAARELLTHEIEKLQKGLEEFEAKQLVTHAQQQEVERKVQTMNQDIEQELRLAEKQFGTDHPKLKELKEKRNSLLDEATKRRTLAGPSAGSSASISRLHAQLKLREKLLLEVEEKMLRLQLRLDD